MLGSKHGLRHALLEEAQLRALGNGMADGKLDHVAGPWEERDHIVEDARPLHVRAVFKVELFRFEVGLIERASHE